MVVRPIFVAACYVLMSAFTPLYSISLPGTSIICSDADQMLTLKMGDDLGGGWWPKSDIIIIRGATISVSYSPDDPLAEAMIGLLGPSGDILTPLLIGAGYTPLQITETMGREFKRGDEIHFHVKCSRGSTARLNGAIFYTVPAR